jgi:hypothetical protein
MKQIKKTQEDISPELKTAAEFLTRDNIKAGVADAAAKMKFIIEKVLKYSMQSKSGLEFLGLREYQASDDASLIDWKVSARMNPGPKLEKLYVKVYEEEFDYNVFVLIDCSSTMLYSTKGTYKMLYSARIAMSILMAINNAMALTGMAMFSDDIKYLLTIGAGEDQINGSIRELSTIKNYGGKCNLSKAIKKVSGNLNDKTIFLIITDAIDMDKNWKEGLKGACGKFEKVGMIIIRDPIDNELPKDLGYFRFYSPYEYKKIEINTDKYREKYKKMNQKHLNEILDFSMTVGAKIKYYKTTQDITDSLIMYFNSMLNDS